MSLRGERNWMVEEREELQRVQQEQGKREMNNRSPQS
jgi:hypothetical protein